MKWPEFSELGRRLGIKAGDTVALVNAPSGYDQKIPGADGCSPERADAVIGFTARRGDLDQLVAVYVAALAGRRAWIGYPKPGGLATDLSRDLLARDVRKYGVQSVESVPIDRTWSGLLLRPIETEEAAAQQEDIDMAWPGG